MLQRNLPSASPAAVTKARPVRAGWAAIRVLIAGAALLALFSLPIFFSGTPHPWNGAKASLQYRLFFYGGVNF